MVSLLRFFALVGGLGRVKKSKRCTDVLSFAPLKWSIGRSLLSFFAASSLVSISTQTLLYSSRFSFAKILNAGHGLLVSRQQKLSGPRMK